MKTIGFIDYYISEWHANNYPKWIAEATAALDEEFVVKYAWAEQDVSPLDGVTTAEWCEKMGVTMCKTIEEVCEAADYLLILAPSNPEKHLAYAEVALKYGKNTYIDKTFAPDYATAKKIFDIAAEYGTRFFSTSALRYATELDLFVAPKNLLTLGCGSNLDEYIIHQIEMAVKLLKSTATDVRVDRQGENQFISSVSFANGAAATLTFAPVMPYAVCAEDAEGKAMHKAITSPYFKSLIADILRFYATGETSFDTAETLEVMRIREAIVRGKETPGVRRAI